MIKLPVKLPSAVEEEKILCLWFIIGLLAYQNQMRVLAWVSLAKVTLDLACVISASIREIRAARKDRRPSNTNLN